MELKGKRVLVVGLGESGLAMARWLHRQGARVRVADSRSAPPNVDALAQFVPGCELLAGPFAAAPFAWADLVALSPGVPKATPEIATVDGKIVSEIELFAAGVREYVPGSKIIAITGSNGKTCSPAHAAGCRAGCRCAHRRWRGAASFPRNAPATESALAAPGA